MYLSLFIINHKHEIKKLSKGKKKKEQENMHKYLLLLIGWSKNSIEI